MFKKFYSKIKKYIKKILVNKNVEQKDVEQKDVLQNDNDNKLSFNDKIKASQNKVYTDDVIFIKSEINFQGSNNILYIEKGTKIINTTINFLGDNSIVFIKKSKHNFEAHINIYNDSVFYLGSNNSVNGKKPVFQLSERKNIFIGNDNMFSFNISFRLADPHLIYSSKSRSRINESKSIYIGDHVWIGQNVKIFKNSKIGSGSIIGGESLVTKKVPSNSIYGGNPAKEIKRDIFWLRPSVHKFTIEDSLKWDKYDDDLFIFRKDQVLTFEQIEENLLNCNGPIEKMEYLLTLPENKNRFYIQ